ncbi:aminoglycoside phosphotransferase family protein [Ectothiorhodospiraceae bacterium BW-2]|nr:aminoglycoside phosphotransferase family protein [Ectothiorhodospiraceae bacterium BW-2]
MENLIHEAQLYSISSQLLVRAAAEDTEIERISLLCMGGNNRSYCIESGENHQKYLLKHYFQHDGDNRNRLQTEYDFLVYANHVCPGSVPAPLALSAENGMALYEYIDGEHLQPDELGQQEVDAAINFLNGLNQPIMRYYAEKLPPASESPSSLIGHLNITARRIQQLLAIDDDGIGGKGVDFINELAKFWKWCRESIEQQAYRRGWAMDALFSQGQCCVSPSDFGFHNALRTDKGEIYFIDFEYAGWDDPVKTVIDFFLQPAVQVPMKYYQYFIDRSQHLFADVDDFRTRIQMLYPVYQVKWCCIMLNIFLPVHMKRRKFANPMLDETALKIAQLTKAQTVFQSIKEYDYGIY